MKNYIRVFKLILLLIFHAGNISGINVEIFQDDTNLRQKKYGKQRNI